MSNTALNVVLALVCSLAINTVYKVLRVCLQHLFGSCLDGWMEDSSNNFSSLILTVAVVNARGCVLWCEGFCALR